MEQMKKLFCTLMAALMVLQLAACGGKTEASVSAEASSTPAQMSEQQLGSAPVSQSASEEDSAVPEEILGEVETAVVELPISEEKLTYSMFMTMPFFVGSLIDKMGTDLQLFRTPSNDGSYNIPNGVSLNAEENEEYAKLESDISTYVEETINAWIVGQNTLDQQAFDSFKAQLQQMGIDRMVELKQAAYDRYQSKLENLNA